MKVSRSASILLACRTQLAAQKGTGSLHVGKTIAPPMTAADIQINFDAPASLRKWPSIGSERRDDTRFPSPYLLQDGTLLECIEALLSKPAASHHLYEVHTTAQEPWVKSVLSTQHVYELMRLRKVLTF
jgi:hypothetical protein